MPQFLQTIPHSINIPGTDSSYKRGGPIIVDTTTFCRGYFKKLTAGTTLSPTTLEGIHSLLEWDGGVPSHCGTSTGTKRWVTPPIEFPLFQITYSGSGTIVGASFSGTGSGKVTGIGGGTLGGGSASPVSGAISVTFSGSATSPTTGSFSGSITGAITATFSGTFSGSTTSNTLTISVPSGFPPIPYTGSASVSGGTFQFGTTITVPLPATWYIAVTMSSANRGGVAYEVCRVDDNSVVARYTNAHHGLLHGQLEAELYLESSLGCAAGLATWIYRSPYFPPNLGLRMRPYSVVTEDYDGFELPDVEDLHAGSDGVGIGALIDGFSEAHPRAYPFGVQFDSFVAVLDDEHSFGNPRPQIPSGLVGHKLTFREPSTIYEDTVEITVINQGASMGTTYQLSLTEWRGGYGPMLASATITLRGSLSGICFRVSRTRRSDASVVNSVTPNLLLRGIYFTAPTAGYCSSHTAHLQETQLIVGQIAGAFPGPGRKVLSGSAMPSTIAVTLA